MKYLFIVYFIFIIFSLSINSQTITAKEKLELTEKVKQEFLHSWNAYQKYAWGHDDLKPLSKSWRDWYSESLLMTAIDALDALYIMGFKQKADYVKEFIINNISFNKDFFVKNFEITIRILGGLLSSYQITNDERLLNLADDLGKRLLPVFNSKTGMPYMFVNLKTGEVKGEISNPAEIGTLLIEFGTLSKLTNNPVYFDKAKKALVELFNRRSSIGLVGTKINVESGEWVDSTNHISGMIDSYYEYLLKGWILFEDEDCKKMWEASIQYVNKYLAHKSETGLWYRQVNMFSGNQISTRYGALDAFFPAVLVLSGDTLRAKELQESSFKMWNLHGIEPEEIDYSTMEVTYPAYPLRPEIIESAFYLYFFTKDEQYLTMGKVILDNLIKYCKVDEGYVSLKDVITKEKKDEMESFFLTETLKYLYLLFEPDNTIDLKRVVFNTEAHPIKKTW
ncbi:MAG TPA: glycoside hydrolase family 47 protein [Ignavibacteriaceae bacterium]|nr:glycoside hydrolase family 47 protein [Ignavibacteriaceae bacterium]